MQRTGMKFARLSRRIAKMAGKESFGRMPNVFCSVSNCEMVGCNKTGEIMRTVTGWALIGTMLVCGAGLRAVRAEEGIPADDNAAAKALDQIQQRIAEIEHTIQLELAEGDEDEIVELAPEMDALMARMSEMELQLTQSRLSVLHAQMDEIKHEMELEKAEGDDKEAEEMLPRLNALTALEAGLKAKLAAAKPADSLDAVRREIEEIKHAIELERAEGDNAEADELLPKLAQLQARKEDLEKRMLSGADEETLESVRKKIAEVEHSIALEKAEGDDEEIPPLQAKLEALKALEQTLNSAPGADKK